MCVCVCAPEDLYTIDISKGSLLAGLVGMYMYSMYMYCVANGNACSNGT